VDAENFSGHPGVHHCYNNFNGGERFGSIEAGKATASVLRSRLITTLTETVGCPPWLMRKKIKKEKAQIQP
jgi:hypothetical protein